MGEIAQPSPIAIWAAGTGGRAGIWATIRGLLHGLIGGLAAASGRSFLSEMFIRGCVADRRALTGGAESSRPGVEDLGLRS